MSENERTLVLVHNLEQSAILNTLVYLDESWKPLQSGTSISQQVYVLKNMSEPIIVEKVYERSKVLEKKLLTELAIKLNEHHGTLLSERAWKIILGHWLRMYSQIVCKHTVAIQEAFGDGISEVFVDKQIDEIATPVDTSDANYGFENKNMIERICKEVCLAMQKNLTYIVIPKNKSTEPSLNHPHLKYRAGLKEKIQEKLKKI